MVTVPPDLPVVRELSRNPEARRWLAALPGLIDEVRDRFGLTLGAALDGGSCSWVAPATLPDGTPAIVKIGWPHREMYAEPAALRLWAGRGAVRLLGHDPGRHALILQRCDPGGRLADDARPASERLRVGAGLLRLLWSAGLPEASPADPIESLVDVTADWADLVEERMARLRPGYDPGLVAEGARLLHDLPASAPHEVVVHGDFNPGNILATGGGWLAIDPKPMIGDPAYDLWPLLDQVDDPYAYPDPARILRDRIALLAGELDLDPARIAAWCVARKVESALWAAHHGRPAEGTAQLHGAHILARLA
ncbi:aminoglycoside phosphotransferase family protein [Actinoplanes sp. NPDC049681]|uniref:aminoglycoside phosphotransferase family protein n=1 Tax=Actinoplanes sp. NPDC049681 TaxID=3363905 RepID=UPI0037B8A6D2